MKTLHIAITVLFVTALITNTGVVLAQYGPGFSPVEHYPPVNDTALKLLVMNSTEFKERTIGFNYTLAGIDHNWISKGNNYYDFGGARVTFFVFGFQNGTTKGDVFNIDSQMKIKNVFEYNADNPPAGYYTDRCMGCPLETGTKPKCCDPYVPIPIQTPLKQFHSGIKPEYVKCSQNLHLIIKAEDGSFACVTIETGKNLAMRGWATTFGTGISTNDYYTKCDTLYPQSDTGIAVLYMPVNSIGKICVQYHNLNNTPTSIGMRIFEANDLTQNASNVTAWTYDSTLEANANKTIVYFIKTGTSAGFYGASLNCGGIPLAVGYDANSTITASDFPWVGHVFNCGIITYESHMEGTAGIGVRYIPYSYVGLK
ncbi:MAG TPA: hypothetical protein VFU58_07265 [Candidatus Nitrosotalea sp.]|nr:hypothetical protein [Candidatus Nitrosotalea sp.]